jgi:DNA-binding MarR family transcriptional regulator
MTPDRQPLQSPANDLEGELGWAIRLTSEAFRRTATGSVAALPGGPRGYLVLTAASSGPPRSQLAIAQQLALNKTVMTYLLDELETEGLITRRADPSDRRARHVLVTPEGTRALDVARARLRTAEARLLADLDPAEERQLRSLLERVARTARTVETDVDMEC